MTQDAPQKTIRGWHMALIGILILMFAMFAAGLGRDAKFLPSPLIGKQAFNFDLKRLGGGEQIKLSDYHGKVVVMNYWASWCVSCREEHHVLLEASRKHGADKNVQFLGISHKDNDKAAFAFLDKMGHFPYPSGIDRQGRLALEFGVYGMPETFFISKSGVIAAKQIGPLTMKSFEEKLKLAEAAQ